MARCLANDRHHVGRAGAGAHPGFRIEPFSEREGGAGNSLGWCACVWDQEVFLKRFEWDAAARYPDFGCNNEIYAEGDFLEIESLGPLGLLAPDATVEHTERWFMSTRTVPGASPWTAEGAAEAAEAAQASLLETEHA